jgi:hypothetical protein
MCQLCYYLFFLVTCKKENNDPGKEPVNQVSNVKFTGLDNKVYEFRNYTDNNKNILLFGFATWCGFSLRELKNILTIDSVYSDRIAIIGLVCADDTINIKKFIINNRILFPVTKIFWNNEFDRILFPDSVYSVPKIALIDKNLIKVYVQKGYSENTIDSVIKYLK